MRSIKYGRLIICVQSAWKNKKKEWNRGWLSIETGPKTLIVSVVNGNQHGLWKDMDFLISIKIMHMRYIQVNKHMCVKSVSARSSLVMCHNNNHCQPENEGVSFREGDEGRAVVIMQA